jgi:hypothetical protein
MRLEYRPEAASEKSAGAMIAVCSRLILKIRGLGVTLRIVKDARAFGTAHFVEDIRARVAESVLPTRAVRHL